jgi:hypothetical protein
MAKRGKMAKRAPRGMWSDRDLNLLKKEFPENPTARVAVKLHRQTDAVKKKAARMGLKKSRRYLKSLGRS